MRPALAGPGSDQLRHHALGHDIAGKVPIPPIDRRAHERMEEQAMRHAMEKIMLGGNACGPER